MIHVAPVAAVSAVPATADQMETASAMRAPAAGDTLQTVRKSIEEKISGIRSLSCEVEMSKARDKKDPKKSRKVHTGPLEIAREHGGRLQLTRKGHTEEYIANWRVIWSYDHKNKEARFIPTSTPVIGFYVQEAMRLNAFLSVDEDTLQLRGTQDLNGEPCWVLEGRSPRRLKTLGVPVTRISVWISRNDGLPRKIHVPSENDLTIYLRNYVTNPAIGPQRFEWTPPQGVKTRNIFGF
jgi:outer membrane lipoprotein-sorting protein